MIDTATQKIHDETKAKLEEMRKRYGAADLEMPTRILEALRSILTAQSIGAAEHFAHRTIQKWEMHLLHSWAKKKIDGPEELMDFEKKARKADSLADMLEQKGDQEAATKQRARARDYRQQAAEQASAEVAGTD